MGTHHQGRTARHLRQTLAAVVSAGLLLAGCSQGSPGPSASGTPGEPVTLTFSWWGNDTRDKLTREVIATFESAHPTIKVQADPTDWNSYWQKLSTQMAGGSGPDLLQMDEKYIAEYADKGALYDLGALGITTQGWASGTVEAGNFDGKLYAATLAVNSPVFIANKTLFDKVGVAIPDDSTWTWDDFAKLAVDLQKKSGGEFFGAQSMIGFDGATKLWIRQQGAQQFTADGIGFDASQAQSWFQYWLDLQTAGGTPPATAAIEDQTTAIDQALTGTNRIALSFQWSNQVNALQSATGSDLVLLRPPTQTGKATDGKMWYKSSQYLSASATTKHPAEVKLFMDYFINDPQAGAILGTERGVPTNLKVRETIAGSLDEVNTKVVTFMDAIAGELGTGGSVPLPGGGQSEAIQRRASDQVLLGQLDPATAATQFVTELKAEMGLG